MFGSIWLPICLFSFGATSMPSIHWIVPIICSSFFSVGTFLLFQSVLNYLQDAYPDKAASVLAGNDFFRSMMGACFPLFSIQMFERLGFHVFWGSVLLGCLSLLFVPIPFVLYRVSPSCCLLYAWEDCWQFCLFSSSTDELSACAPSMLDMTSRDFLGSYRIITRIPFLVNRFWYRK